MYLCDGLLLHTGDLPSGIAREELMCKHSAKGTTNVLGLPTLQGGGPVAWSPENNLAQRPLYSWKNVLEIVVAPEITQTQKQ